MNVLLIVIFYYDIYGLLRNCGNRKVQNDNQK